MRGLKTDVSFGACLEVREISFIRSFAQGNWVSSIYTPPVTAEFLRRVSLRIVHGEVHGVIGASGCGKSTLLKVVANRLEGKLDGQVLLNGQSLTRDRFASLCAFVDLDAELLGNLTVEQALHYHARLSLNCKLDAVNYRVFTLMQQFDLGAIANLACGCLRQADRRRLLIAMHLVKDPVLLVIDEPLKGLDALSAFQLMSSLQDYMKRQARMALVSMRCPRSDIYQLLSQLTLLFYGETVYSGPAKQMPHYFSQIGFRCPSSENPAVYYLSLASVDRETPESYNETHTKASKLAEVFRERKQSLAFLSTALTASAEVPILSSFYGTPSTTTRVATLIARHLGFVGRSASFVFAQFLLPLLLLMVAIFGASATSRSWTTPKSVAGSFFTLTLCSALGAVWATAVQFAEIRGAMFFEVSLKLYNASAMFFVFLLLGSALDALSVGLGAFAFVWKTTDDVQLDTFAAVFGSVWCVYGFYKCLTLAVAVCTDSVHKTIVLGSLIAVGMSTLASGFLKSYQSFMFASKYLVVPTFASIERFTSLRTAIMFVNGTRVQNCTRDEFRDFANLDSFCRWRSGADYLSEVLPEGLRTPEWWIGPLLTGTAACVTFVFFLLITQQCAQRKVAKLHRH